MEKATDKSMIKARKLLQQEDDLFQACFLEENPWGLSISVDLYHCNVKFMKDEKKVRSFVKKLLAILDMKSYGDTQILDFGTNPRVSGYSFIQFMETSGIVGHFANQSHCVYLDIFSCRSFRPHEVADFCKKFFEADKMHLNITFRH